MSTTNLGLKQVLDSDYIPDAFDKYNDAIEAIDTLAEDYVVSHGTSGEWWYRRWKSGRYECGIDYKGFGTQTMTALSTEGMYATQMLSFGAYPVTFASRPFTSISFEGDGAHTETRASFVVPQTSTSTETSPSFFVADFSSDAMNPYCGIYACGTLV